MGKSKNYILGGSLEADYQYVFIKKNNTKRNFRLYNRLFSVDKNGESQEAKLVFNEVKYSAEVLEVINNLLDKTIRKIIKKSGLFDDSLYSVYKKEMVNRAKELNNNSYINGKLVGSNWSSNDRSKLANQSGIIMNQFDMACKIICSHNRNGVENLKSRFNESISKSGFNIDITELKSFLLEKERSKSEEKNKIYTVFLAYLFTVRNIRKRLVLDKSRFEDNVYEELFNKKLAQLNKIMENNNEDK